MGFVKIEKTTAKRSGVDAIYRLNSNGKGTLRFTKEGSEKLVNIKTLDVNKAVEVYIDRETKSLAFKQSENGQFKLSGAKSVYTLSYSDINKEIRETVRYVIEDSSGYAFVLRPASETLKTPPQDSSQTQASDSDASSDSEPKAKKSRSKKK